MGERNRLRRLGVKRGEGPPPQGVGEFPAVPPDGGQNPEPDGDGDTDGEAGEE